MDNASDVESVVKEEEEDNSNNNNNVNDDALIIDDNDKDCKPDRISWLGYPPPLPDPFIISNDISCQGVMGITLRETLQEVLMVNEEESTKEQNNDNDDNDGRNSNNTYNDDDTTRNNDTNKDDETVTVNKENNYGNNTNDNDDYILLSEESINRILLSFGESIAKVQEKQWLYEKQHQQEIVSSLIARTSRKTTTTKDISSMATTTNDSSTTASSSTIPLLAGLIRGRIQYYNRYGSKWRFIIDNAAELMIPRTPLHRNRRKRDHTSLHTSLLQQNEQEHEQIVVKLPRTLEILAYNDIED